MLTSPFRRLLAVTASLRMSDQIMVAGVPLMAAAHFGLKEDQIGAMVAIQGSAWLFLSLSAGLLVDRIAPFDAMRRALLISAIGFVLAIGGAWGMSPALFTLGAFVSAAAIVIGYLAEGAGVQRLITGPQLGTANARVQIIQSGAMLLGPSLMGALMARGFPIAGLISGLALLLCGLLAARGFPPQDAPERSVRAPLVDIGEGFAFVRSQPLLRGVVACALFWNMAYLALAAVFGPYALRGLAMTPDSIGLAQSAMGIGSVLASFAAAPAMAKLPPRFILFFGPATSTAAVALLYFGPAIGGTLASVATYLLLGFGPILWFVCQNTIRQLVTPSGLLGRVGAVIQLAIYGVRSIGALLGGWVAAHYGSETALLMIMALFAVSAITVVMSALGKLAVMPVGVTEVASGNLHSARDTG